MERSEQPRGWKGETFSYGRGKSQSVDELCKVVPEETEKRDNCCSKESCGCGCYMTVVDLDRLDQQ